MKILVAHAVAQELAAFTFPVHVTALVTGVGIVEASTAVAAALAHAHFDLVINAGIAGGFAPETNVGMRVVVTQETYADLGREDYEPLALPDGIPLHVEAYADTTTLAQIAVVQAQRSYGITSAMVTTSDNRATALRRRFPQAAVESMEGFAVLRAAAAAGIPALELRGVSNRVGERSRSGWDFRAGSLAVVSLLHEVIALLS